MTDFRARTGKEHDEHPVPEIGTRSRKDENMSKGHGGKLQQLW